MGQTLRSVGFKVVFRKKDRTYEEFRAAYRNSLTGIILMYRRQTLNKLTVIAASFAAVAVECVAIEWLIAAANGMSGVFIWSPFVLAPCIFISLALFFVNYNRAVREEVRRWVHF